MDSAWRQAPILVIGIHQLAHDTQTDNFHRFQFIEFPHYEMPHLARAFGVQFHPCICIPLWDRLSTRLGHATEGVVDK